MIVEVMCMKVTNMVYGLSLMGNRSRQKKQNNNTKRTGNTSRRISVKIGFNASGTMARIAAAKTKSQAAAIERSLRAQLKDAIRYEGDETTIRAMKKAISKAGTKVKALGKEERMKNMKKVAASADNIREEKRIREELARKKRARKSKERAEIADYHDIVEKSEGQVRDDIHRRYDEDIFEYGSDSLDIICDGIDISSELQGVDMVAGTAVDVCL